MDNLLTNKYFCIAILIALVVVIYLYSQSDYCSMEGMQNVDLMPLGQELNQHPWTDDVGGSKYGRVNTEFDLSSDDYVKKKLKKNKYNVANFLPRLDTNYMNYAKFESSLTSTPTNPDTTSSPVIKKKPIKKRRKYNVIFHSL